MRIQLIRAAEADTAGIFELRMAVAHDLTSRFGMGHWSRVGTERSVASDISRAQLFIVRQRSKVIATLTLAAKKPWAIDVSYFTPCNKAAYLLGMAVSPKLQGCGVGRQCIEQAKILSAAWPADAIRLDAYDAEAGAGEFYRKCSFREMGRVVYRKVPLIYFEMLLMPTDE